MKHKHVITGGTFDHLHLGHQRLLETAFTIGEKVTIGLAEKKLYEKKLLANTIEPYDIRLKALQSYLSTKNWLTKSLIIPISDIYGSTLIDDTIEAVVVSQASKPNAEKINQLRRKKGWPEIKIIIVPDVLAEDGKLVTSERIRIGEIDRNGNSYSLLVIRNWGKNKKELILPENNRDRLIKQLRTPLGVVNKKLDRSLLCYGTKMQQTPIISIGDIVSTELQHMGVNPNIKIIDHKSKRLPITDKKFLIWKKFTYTVDNRAGTVNIDAAAVIRKAINSFFQGEKDQTIFVRGEEDLLALPAILFAPLGALVLYGQWELGVVVVEVTEKVKQKVIQILTQLI